MSQNETKTLEQYLAAEYEVRVRKTAKGYALYLPELGLRESADSLEAAYAKLGAAKKRHLEEFASEGLLDWLPLPGQTAGPGLADAKQPSVLRQLKPFLIKAAVITLMFLGAVNIIGQGVRDTGYKLEKQLEGLSNWSPEKVEWHRERAQRIAEKLGPTVREILVMFREPAPAQAPVAGTPHAEPKE